MQFVTSLSANFIFHPPPGSPSKLQEILIALIPNHSIFKQYQDICNHTDIHGPRARNKNLEVRLALHSSAPSFSVFLSYLSPPHSLIPLFSIYAFWSWLCLSNSLMLSFSHVSLSDVRLDGLVSLQPPPPTPPPPPPRRKAGMCQTVASL